MHTGEASVVAGGNGVDPMAGSALQYVRRVREEKTVEVVRNHEGGTRGGMASRFRRRRSNVALGVDSRAANGGGAIFGQPQERRSGRETGSIGLVTPGKWRQGQEGRYRYA